MPMNRSHDDETDAEQNYSKRKVPVESEDTSQVQESISDETSFNNDPTTYALHPTPVEDSRKNINYVLTSQKLMPSGFINPNNLSCALNACLQAIRLTFTSACKERFEIAVCSNPNDDFLRHLFEDLVCKESKAKIPSSLPDFEEIPYFDKCENASEVLQEILKKLSTIPQLNEFFSLNGLRTKCFGIPPHITEFQEEYVAAMEKCKLCNALTKRVYTCSCKVIFFKLHFYVCNNGCWIMNNRRVENLDLDQTLNEIVPNDVLTNFEVVAVINFEGYTPYNGHFTTFVRGGNQWLKCDDRVVSPLDWSSVVTWFPYILALQRK